MALSREQAIQLAQQVCTRAFPGAGDVENPHDPVARLMPFGEFEARTGSGYPSDDPADYVWVVQFEGESLDRFESTRYHYAGCAIDAARGVIRHEFRRLAEPYLIPTPTPTPRPRLMALIIGILVERDGCLAVVPEHPSDPVALIWTKEWHVVRRDGSNVTVVDTYDGKTTSVTWQLGQEVRLGGGTAGPLKDTGQFTVGECAGPYWLVGDVR